MVKAFKGAARGLGGDDVTSALPWISATAGGAFSSLIGRAHLHSTNEETRQRPMNHQRSNEHLHHLWPVEHITITEQQSQWQLVHFPIPLMQPLLS
jgi:hypothetical protein